MEKLSEVFKIIIDHFGYFLGIDLLSLFVSGASCLGAFAFVWIQLAHQTIPNALTQGFGIAVIVLACYVLGMICFAFGRWVRTSLFEGCQGWVGKKLGYQKIPIQSPKFLLEVLEDHALSKEDFVKRYIGNHEGGSVSQDPDRATGRLYTRLWAEVRQSPSLMASYTLLNRYWFMAATYDGLATALIVWLMVVIAWSFGLWGISPKLNPFTSITLGGTLVLLTITCWREAERYKRYQIEELVATLAYQERKLKSNKELPEE